MAESGLSIDYNTLKREVGRFLGWSRTYSGWSAEQNTDFDDVSKKALREFYYPAVDINTPRYEWSFLRAAGTITLNTSSSTYVLPDNFSGVILDDSVTWAAAEPKLPLKKIPESEIRKLHANDSQIKTYPRYYATRNKAHAPTTGQRYEMIVYPIVNSTNASKVLHYRYVYLPDQMSGTNKYPAGGALYSEVILAAHLAAAESTLDSDTEGQYTTRFRTLLAQAVRNDQEQKENNRGGEA